MPIASSDVPATDWIPAVAARGWLIITRDCMITQNRNKIVAVRENKAKMVALNQRDAQTKCGQLEVFMTQWRSIEAVISEPTHSSGGCRAPLASECPRSAAAAHAPG